MSKYVIGVDVGGTSVKLGLVNPQGEVLHRTRVETQPFLNRRAAFIQAIADSVLQLIKESNVPKSKFAGVGLGLPGPIDFDQGIVRFLPNIPGWSNVPLQKTLEAKLKLPVRIDNDVNLITLGEWYYGAAKQDAHVICIALGTGVGGGLILNNQLYRGQSFAAGEIGHTFLPGAVHKGSSLTSFEQVMGHKQLSKLAAQIYGVKKPISTRDMFAKADKGEKKALKFWEEVGTYIGYGLAGPITLLNPRCIVIGGGVANNYKHFHQAVKKVIKKHVMKTQAQTVRVVRAKLGDSAGIMGARVLLEQSLGKI